MFREFLTKIYAELFQLNNNTTVNVIPILNNGLFYCHGVLPGSTFQYMDGPYGTLLMVYIVSFI